MRHYLTAARALEMLVSAGQQIAGPCRTQHAGQQHLLHMPYQHPKLHTMHSTGVCLQDTNQKLQAKVRDAAAGSNATEAQLDSLQAKVAKQQ